MKVVAITQIWPNSLEPISSPFNLQQFAELARKVELTVIAAVPYFPGARVLGQPARAALLTKLPARELLHGIETVYMRQAYVPKLGVPIAVPLYLASLAPHRRLVAEADVVLAAWAYPDGCASIVAARALGKPCAVKVHGSDVNLIAKLRSARAVLRRVLPRADALVTVSRPLSDELADLGVSREKIHFVANGVNTALFRPRVKEEARGELGLPRDAKIVLFVGRLEPQKGLGELLAAWARVRAARPDAVLALIGEGVSRADVDARGREWGAGLVVPGPKPLAEVARWVAACDVFALPSWAEGTPNVVLEALASGRPVVGSRVGGIPDVLSDPRSGIVVPPHDERALAAALLEALAREWDAEVVRACGPGSWADSADRLLGVLSAIAR